MDAFNAERTARRECALALAWDEDVLATERAAQVHAELAEVDRTLEQARRDWITPPEMTSWMFMSAAERAEIRPPRRRAADGSLILLHGQGRPASSVDAEAA